MHLRNMSIFVVKANDRHKELQRLIGEQLFEHGKIAQGVNDFRPVSQSSAVTDREVTELPAPIQVMCKFLNITI